MARWSVFGTSACAPVCTEVVVLPRHVPVTSARTTASCSVGHGGDRVSSAIPVCCPPYHVTVTVRPNRPGDRVRHAGVCMTKQAFAVGVIPYINRPAEFELETVRAPLRSNFPPPPDVRSGSEDPRGCKSNPPADRRREVVPWPAVLPRTVTAPVNDPRRGPFIGIGRTRTRTAHQAAARPGSTNASRDTDELPPIARSVPSRKVTHERVSLGSLLHF